MIFQYSCWYSCSWISLAVNSGNGRIKVSCKLISPCNIIDRCPLEEKTTSWTICYNLSSTSPRTNSLYVSFLVNQTADWRSNFGKAHFPNDRSQMRQWIASNRPLALTLTMPLPIQVHLQATILPVPRNLQVVLTRICIYHCQHNLIPAELGSWLFILQSVSSRQSKSPNYSE